MNIGFVITNISFSGAQNVFNAVTAELENRGHSITILATNETKDISAKQANIYGLLSSEGRRYGKQLKKVISIRKIAKEKELDALISFGFNSNIKTILAGIKSGIPVIVCERMDPRHSPEKTAYLLRLERWILYRFAQGYIVQTNEIKQFFSHKIQGRTFIIHNPIRDLGQECVAANERLKRIVTVTRLDEKQKNLVHLLHTFAQFAKIQPEYTLHIVGDGPDEQMLKNTAKALKIDKSVFFTGKLKNPVEYLKTADFFTLVSTHEGMPNALLEAMSLGLPCIVERFGGGAAEELITDHKNGILLKTHNQKDLLCAFKELAKDENLKKTIGLAAFGINETHSIQKIGELWENAILETVKRS